MAGSRSAAQRRRRRNTTSRAVDFLNNIHSPTDRVSLSSPVRPRRSPRRQTEQTKQFPQNYVILGSPESPEEGESPVSKPILQSEPITPRLSSRKIGPVHPSGSIKLGNDSISSSGESSDHESDDSSDESESNTTKRIDTTGGNQQTPRQNEDTRRSSLNKKPPGSQPDINPTIEIQIGRESSDGSSDDNSDEDSESEGLNKVASRKDQPEKIGEEPKEIEVNPEHSIAELPFMEKSDVSFSVGEDDDSENDSEDSFQDSFQEQEGNPSPPDATIQDRYEEVDSTRVILFSSDSDEDDDERHSMEFSPSQQLQHEQEINVNSAHVAKDATTPEEEREIAATSEEITKDTTVLEHEPGPPVDSEPEAEDAAKESDYSPSMEESASEGSPGAASGLFRYTPEGSEDSLSPAASPKDRPRLGNKIPVVEMPGQQRASSVSTRLQNHHNSRSDEGASSSASTRSTEKPRYIGDIGDSPWFTEAKLLGGQKENWEILISETLAASELVSSSRAHYFLQIETLMMSLRKEYTGLFYSLKKQRQPSPETRQTCERIRRSLDNEGDKLREMIYYRAARRDEQLKSLSGELAEEFEARVYYPMVRLILQCFEAYRHHGMHRRFQWAYDHLLQTMKLLQKFCRRSNAQNIRGYVKFRSRAWSLISVLNNLIDALEKGALSDPVPTALNQREWTDVEGYALLKGLKRWQGPERFHRILEQYPSRLGGRTIGELRAKAQQMQDANVSLYEEKAKTQEQRREWQWLMEL
ncbi:uncharacterized protein KD926_004001 [Aspergillus affinis]|uniref:uncharacterized protein n=1 Tax=Aspergillus affinis TaxID=1070780 RepID=UPI0022FEC5BE|nr:uncharacterized protein KD926_004001 [Aspergillus affinis]KAI9046163.1 hypothetical protein KD926_004001 [Aspergillus affinis]